MSDLNLNFLEDKYSNSQTTYIDLLEKYGTQICTYGKNYFDRIVTYSELEGEIQDVNLYILVPELPYEYRILSIEIKSINIIKVILFSLLKSPQASEFDITKGISDVEERIKQYLESGTANESLRLLVSKVNLKRKSIENKETNLQKNNKNS